MKTNRNQLYSILLTAFLLCIVYTNIHAGCPTIVMSGSDVSCSGYTNGSAQVAISSGSGNYTISWSNGANSNSISGLSVGTYTVHVKDNVSGCTVIGAFVVGSPNPITVTESVNDVTCYGLSTGSVDVTINGGNTPYTSSWSNSSTSEDLLNVPAGTYTMNITDGEGCSYSKIYTINEPAEALQANASVTPASCFSSATGEIDLSVWGGTPAYTYSWSSGQSTADITGLTSGNYVVNITDVNGCSINLSYDIIQPSALGGTTSPIGVTCYGLVTGSVSFTPSGGTAPYSYSWQNSSTLFSATGPSLTNVIADDYQLTVTDHYGCQYVDSFTISQPPQLLISSTGNNVTCFSGVDGSIDVTVSGGTQPYSFAWTDQNGSPFSTLEDLTNLQAGFYNLTLTDGALCSETYQHEVTQPSMPIFVTANVSNVLCNGDNSGTIDLTVAGGTPPYQYSWTTGQSTQDIDNLLAGSYGYTIVDFKNCSYSGSYIVDQPLQPLSSSHVITDVSCFGLSDGLIDLTISGGTAPYTYSWSNSNYLLSYTSQDLLNFPAEQYRYQLTDDNGCLLIDTLIINEPNELSTSVIGTDILCKGDVNGTIDLTVNGGLMPYVYSWSNGSVTQDVNSLGSGMYVVIVTDSNNCIIQDSLYITEPIDSLSFSYTVSPVLCNNGTDGYINLAVLGGSFPYTYIWSSADSTSFISDLTAGYYSFTVLDSNQCSLHDSILVIEPAPLILNEIVTPVSCIGLEDGDIDISPSGGTAPFSFTWFDSQFALSAQTEDLTDFKADVYHVEVVDSNNCFYDIYIPIPEPDSLIISYNLTDVSCAGATGGEINITVTGGNLIYTYQWSNGDTTANLLNASEGTYQLVVVDQKNCSDSITFVISEPDSISLTFDVNPLSCIDKIDGSASVLAEGGSGDYTYLWSNGIDQDLNTDLNSAWYSVIVTDILGCTVQDSVFVPKGLGTCIIPVNTFSPNGDNYNDTWVIDNLDLYTDMSLKIYNKWGNLIYEQNGDYIPWDGTYEGNQLPSEVYYYKIDLNTPDRESVTGNIIIVR